MSITQQIHDITAGLVSLFGEINDLELATNRLTALILPPQPEDPADKLLDAADPLHLTEVSGKLHEAFKAVQRIRCEVLNAVDSSEEPSTAVVARA